MDPIKQHLTANFAAIFGGAAPSPSTVTPIVTKPKNEGAPSTAGVQTQAKPNPENRA